MLIYNTPKNLVVVTVDKKAVGIPLTLDALFAADDPSAVVRAALATGTATAIPAQPRAPIQSQEVWAAGVTYLRSRTARMEESKDSGGDTFYDKVYHAERPELFFKAAAHRVAATGAPPQRPPAPRAVDRLSRTQAP